ncbi:MAG: restriction endonuclease subunit S [Planctomycetales bacterium]|nr:restriction endonuclease subunit S [Planctomycetales bacterium]
MSSMESSVPKGWRRLKIRDVANIQTGFAFKSDWYVNDGVRLLRNANVSQRCVDWADQVCLPDEQYDEFDAFKMQENDIVLSLDRPLVAAGLKVAMVTSADLPSLLVQRVARFRLSNEIDPSFLYAFLQSPLFINQIPGHDQSLGVPHISPGQVGNISIALPTRPEQKRIANVLRTKIDSVAIAGGSAAKQLEAISLYNASLLCLLFESEDAENWDNRPLEDIAETCSGSTPSRSNSEYFTGDIPWIKTGELKDADINDAEERISDLALAETSLRRLPVGTLLIAMYGQGQTRGRTGLLRIEATTNQACFAILPRPDLFNTRFLQLWFRYQYSKLRAETEGRGGNQPNLNGLFLRKLRVPVPTLSVQESVVRQFENKQNEVNSAVGAAKKQLAAINALPAAILRQAFSGQL